MKRLHSFLRLLLCWFCGVAPAHARKHPNETAYLTTRAIALGIPVVMAGLNAWIVSRHMGCSITESGVVVAFAVGMVYAIERVLLHLVGGGSWRWLAIALRGLIAACLALLLGEAVVGSVFFRDIVDEHYRKQQQARMEEARGRRDALLEHSAQTTQARILPLEETVAQKKAAWDAANQLLPGALAEEIKAREILLAEEEGQAASGLKDRGRRFREKTETYLVPAEAKVREVREAMAAAKAELDTANASLAQALAARDSDPLVMEAMEEYRRSEQRAAEERHQDLGSRLAAMLEVSKAQPLLGWVWLICAVFFTSIDLLALAAKTCGRMGGWEVEEKEEHESRMEALRARIAKLPELEAVMAGLEVEAALNAAVTQGALRESIATIRDVSHFLEEVFEERKRVLDRLDQARSRGAKDIVELCLQSLTTMDSWVQRGLRKATSPFSKTQPTEA